MDRSVRIPTDIIDRLLTGLDHAYRQHLSVGYPLPTDGDANWAFPLFIQIQNVDTFPVLGLQQHFTYYGATVFDVTLSCLGGHTALTFYLITPKDLASQPLPPPLPAPTSGEDWDEDDE